MPASKRPYPSQTIDNDNEPLERPSKRFATIYDAVAGRITQAGFIGHITDEKSSKQPLRPDEVLFKQSNAPVRYEETDYYFAHTRLSPDQQLPSGDLLGAIHAYFSKLYSRTDESVSQKVWKCMDETALIAFGILMEETAREVLGDTGDLAFVEGADEEEEGTIRPVKDKEKKRAPNPTNIEEEREVSDPSSINSSVFASEESDSDGS